MANQKQVAVIQAIIELYKRRGSQRAVARELGIDRSTVQRHVQQWREEQSKPTIATPGTEGDAESNPAISTPGTEPSGESAADSKPAISTPGMERSQSGRPSLCEPFRQRIEEDLEEGLTAQRIYQDLVCESDFSGSYQSVKRFARSLRGHNPKRFHRLESLPGEEAQVDFGSGPRIPQPDGRWRKSSIFRIVLSHSRKAYSEAVYHQDTETFIRCLENAFRYFGGVTMMLVIDNLRAAVNKADWYDPELHPKIESFARHYGTLILPTRPYHPHHKGKVENSVGYIKDNALKGRSFDSLAEVNRYLSWWEEKVADQRIHGTTRRQVCELFEQRERDRLGALPPMPFPCFQEGRRKVHRDSHVEVAKAYYEVPEEYLAREVWVRWDAAMVRIFNLRLEQIVVHARLQPGEFSAEKSTRGRARGVERASGYYRNQAAMLGPGCAQWAQAVVEERGVAAVRILQGLLALAKEHSAKAINTACAEALSHRSLRLRALREHLAKTSCQEQFEFIDQHPLIREMDLYGQFVETQTQETNS